MDFMKMKKKNFIEAEFQIFDRTQIITPNKLKMM